MAQAVKNLTGLAVFGIGALWLGSQSIFTGIIFFTFLNHLVEPGHQAMIFSRFGGLRNIVLKEGFHLKLPYFEWPVIYDVKTKPRNFQATTANRGIFYFFFLSDRSSNG